MSPPILAAWLMHCSMEKAIIPWVVTNPEPEQSAGNRDGKRSDHVVRPVPTRTGLSSSAEVTGVAGDRWFSLLPGITMQEALNRAEEHQCFFRTDPEIPQNLMQKSGSNGFTGMYRNYGSSPVFMPQKMMTATDTRYFESRPAERLNQLTAGNTRRAAHAAILMR